MLHRGQYGPTLDHRVEKVVEDTLQGNAPYCVVFITMLWITGLGMPLDYMLSHGSFRPMHPVATLALVLKLLHGPLR